MITKEQFFSQIIPTTLKHEGGYANHPADKGGETYRGITRKNNDEWQGWKVINEVKRTGKGLNGLFDWGKRQVTSATSYVGDKYNAITGKNTEKFVIPNNTILPELENSVKEHYWQKYFVANGFNKIQNPEIAMLLFDFAVHGGYSHIGLQKLLDQHFNAGIVNYANNFGTKTTNAVNAAGIALKPHILAWRASHLNNIVAKDPTQKVFENNWKSRVASFADKPIAIVKDNKKPILISLGIVLLLVVGYVYYRRSK